MLVYLGSHVDTPIKINVEILYHDEAYNFSKDGVGVALQSLTCCTFKTSLKGNGSECNTRALSERMPRRARVIEGSDGWQPLTCEARPRRRRFSTAKAIGAMLEKLGCIIPPSPSTRDHPLIQPVLTFTSRHKRLQTTANKRLTIDRRL